MKNKIYILIVFLVACFAVACEDDSDTELTGPFTIDVNGSDAVEPETTKTYFIGDLLNPQAFTWSVTGPAQIVGATTGLSVNVKFSAVGDVVLTVTNGSDKGVKEVTVDEIEPAVSSELNGAGKLKSGAKDTVFLSFPAPLAANPTIKLLASSDSSHFEDEELAFSSGTLGSIVKVDAQNYYAIYTAGTGNGIPEALITGVKGTATYGAVEVDSSYIQLYEVDNIAPIAELTYSTHSVNEDTEVTVTTTFSEPIAEDAIITFSGAGVTIEKDTLEATDDELVYTYTYTVTGTGNGRLYVEFENITDLAGNDLAATSESDPITVDNIAPTIAFAIATDGGDFVSLDLTSLGATSGMYLILEDGETAPADVAKFLAATGVASGSITPGVTLNKILAPGDYDVYFITMDAAGNYSAISATSVTMD